MRSDKSNVSKTISFLFIPKFNARAPRIEELRNDIDDFSKRLEERQKIHDAIRVEAFTYVSQLQLNAAILAPVDSGKEDKLKHSTEAEVV